MIGVLALVAGCGPLPRPFGRDAGEELRPLAKNISLDSVEIEPLSGTTKPMGMLLARAVAQKLEKEYEVPAAISGLNNSRYVLTGHVHVPENVGAGNAGIAIGWQLDVRDGEIVSTIVEDVAATQIEWDYGSADVLERVGAQTGEWVAKQILGDRFDDAGTDRLLGRRGIYVVDVTGAPGDGNGALRRAMIVSLAGRGMRMADGIEVAAFTLGAHVVVGPPDNGAQAVRIVWTVYGVDGESLGTADQANAVPAGSLDGNWGQTAAFVAAAAVDGITEIIARNDPSKLRAPELGNPTRARDIGQPPSRQLGRTPGRAPPPPG